MHYDHENWGKMGEEAIGLTPKDHILTFQVPNVYAKFRQNQLRTETIGVTTDRRM